MVPFLVLDMIGIGVLAVVILIGGIILCVDNIIVGLLFILILGLLVGKKRACMYTHTCKYIRTYVYTFNTRI
jgi:hypothetical protein